MIRQGKKIEEKKKFKFDSKVLIKILSIIFLSSLFITNVINVIYIANNFEARRKLETERIIKQNLLTYIHHVNIIPNDNTLIVRVLNRATVEIKDFYVIKKIKHNHRTYHYSFYIDNIYSREVIELKLNTNFNLTESIINIYYYSPM